MLRAAMISVVSMCAAAIAQVELPTDPGAVFDLIRGARQDAPIDEEITVRYRIEGVSDREERYTVRYSPRTAVGPAMLLELGPVHYYADSREALAVNASNPEVFWHRSSPDGTFDLDAALAGVPPVPMPTLRLLRGTIDFSNPLPRVEGVVWASVEPTPRAPRGTITIAGESSVGPVRVVVDAGRWQITRVEAELRGGESKASLTVAVATAVPIAQSSWRPNVEGRTKVNTLAELFAPPAPVRAGAACPDLAVLVALDHTWRLRDDAKKGPVALLMVRSRNGTISDESLSQARTFRERLASIEFPAAAIRTVVFADEVRPTENSLASVYAPDQPRLVTHSPETARRFMGDRERAVLIIDHQMTIRLINEMSAQHLETARAQWLQLAEDGSR